MNSINGKRYVGVETVMHDFEVSKPKAYSIIHSLNKKLKEHNPDAIIIAGKVNRFWYDHACFIPNTNGSRPQ